MLGKSKHITRAIYRDVISNVCCMPGVREIMEDRYTYIIEEKRVYIAVFDGHGGVGCAKFLSSRLCREISKIEKIDGENLTEVFRSVNEEFRKTGDRSGSTCCLGIIESGRLFVCNTGDSSLMVVRGGEIFYKTTEHNFSNPAEIERLETMEIPVIFGRIAGVLSITRTFGDFNIDGVVCDPEIVSFDLREGDIIFLSTNGVSSKRFPPEEIAQILHERKDDDLVLTNSHICDIGMSRNFGDDSIAIALKIGEHDLPIGLKKFFLPTIPFYDQKFADIFHIGQYHIKNRLTILIEKKLSNADLDEYEELCFKHTPGDFNLQRYIEKLRVDLFFENFDD